MTTPYFTIADCDRHDELRKEASDELTIADIDICAAVADFRQCATIRALAAALREALANCGECDGDGEVLTRLAEDGWKTAPCPRCKSGRELMAAVEGKP